jgi:hypothetical protein
VIARVMRREGVRFCHAVALLTADDAPDPTVPAPMTKSTVAKRPVIGAPTEDAAPQDEEAG